MNSKLSLAEGKNQADTLGEERERIIGTIRERNFLGGV